MRPFGICTPVIFGSRLFWGQLKSAFHGGCRRLRSWHWTGLEEIEHEGSTYWTIPGYSLGVTSTAIIPTSDRPHDTRSGTWTTSGSSAMQRDLSKQ